MRRCFFFAVLLAVVGGCGGSGSSTPSPFAGTWNDNTSGDRAALTVGTDGHFTGTALDVNSGTDTFVGSVNNAGSMSGTATNSLDAGVTLTITGNVSLSTPTTLTYTLAIRNPQTNQTTSGSGTLTKQ